MKSKNKWNLKQQAQFCRRLGELLEKGYTLSQGIEFLTLQLSKSQQEDLQYCIGKMKEGYLLHEVLEHLSFHRDLLSYLYFSEQQGELAKALLEGSSIIAKKDAYYKKFIKVIRYPVFLIVVVSLLFVAVQQVLLNQFDQLNQSMKLTKTTFSTILHNVYAITPYIFLTGLCGLILSLAFYFTFFKKQSPILQMNIICKIPFLHSSVAQINSQYFSFQLSTLLSGGLSINEALLIFEQQYHLAFFQIEAARIRQQLTSGECLEAIIKSRPYFEKELALVISHGQSNGNLANELYHYSQYTLLRIEEKVMSFLNILQPALFISVGMIVVFIYLAIMIPMFQLVKAL
ncbi:competence type IV pilus assembly protein ComGB [Cytobacillus sp. IB215316]|uniref:competence type IV pilus assembly protein ComGB n=1 Tax=Cytobacillus sp. IB215316 TaxID=3097354 RepID=UPI002A0EBE33|nr:competence type IV pilus assembly protein ComGB [Cytobacillus sp. IB215316]MDX8359609.1 competence type IV pilus assembly protein ComGB [Cytobacillus sp. IB215316]